MAKLSRSQIVSARRQIKQAREKALEETRLDNPELAAQQEAKRNQKKDKLGFTSEERQAIAEKQRSLETKGPLITWNFDVGSLVYLPCGSVGLIVENNAIELEASRAHDMKKTLQDSRYMGQVFVVTSSGNNWYYPKQLKQVR